MSAQSSFFNTDSPILMLARRPQKRTLSLMSDGKPSDIETKISVWTRKINESVMFALQDDGQSGLADSSVLGSLSESSKIVIKFVFTQESKPRENNLIDYLAKQRRDSETIRTEKIVLFWASLKGNQVTIHEHANKV